MVISYLWLPPNYDIESTCTFLWKIENFNYLWLKNSQYIESPVFVVEELEYSEWRLRLYPRGNGYAEYMEFFLHRKRDDSSKELISVYFEQTFLSENGKILWNSREPQQRLFYKGAFFKCFTAIRHKEVFFRQKSEYLPLNTLTVRCKIWRCDGKVGVDKYLLAETRVAVQRRSFQWKIENFSTIRSTANEVLMEFDLYLTGGQLGGEVIDICIHICDPNAKYLFFQIFASNYKGDLTNCGMKEFRWEECSNFGTKKGTLTLLLSKNQLQSNEPNRVTYLKNGALTLNCECVFSTGIVSETIETVDSGIPSVNVAPPAVRNVGENPIDDTASLREDLGSLCNRDVSSPI
ncbi:speckle-type POZ protein B [Trichonephila inaurata madagascariensis]|uniref:Speckle-type POZ protein B n=1 Tax=Trichonephila inaurata madagascariensis TaxID=2747483 RepID=A0A8X6YVG8_9ARAC|nr:speckle-type POZ protein B [Trichonephila inaurata madagascariensis]